jgi:predicted Ser/Thr protein kinase
VNPESNSNLPHPSPAEPLAGLSPLELLRAAGEPPPPQGTAPSVEDIAAAFPKLEILGLLGQGGMGFVYKARQPDLDRVVALKILRPELGRDPAFSERFAREARVLAKLNHPNIVSVFEHGQADGYFYLLMEYVDGVNLRQAMRAGRFTPEQALAIVPGICDALQAAHAQGIWHRDIKPENILLDQDGRVKIVDFGIARIVGDPARDFTLTLTGAALGSAPYMAPEQHERPHEVDHRADIYSLGVVFYEMLTGELPLGRFPNPSERAAVHARIDAIVLQTLEKERELRQQTATEVKTDIQRAAREGGNTAAEPAPAPSRAESWFSKLPSLVRRSLLAWLGGLLLFGTGRVLQESNIDGAGFPLSIGAVAAGLGFLGGLWSLFEMRRGWLSLTGRGLPFWTMFMPLLLAVAGFGTAVGVTLTTEGHLPFLFAVPVAFACTLLLAWPLRYLLLSGFEKSRGWIIAAGLLLFLALVGGKFLQGKWPFIDARMEEVAFFVNGGPRGVNLAEASENLRKAAGDDDPGFAIEHSTGTNCFVLKGISVGHTEDTGKKLFKSIAARLHQLTEPASDKWEILDNHYTPSHRTHEFSNIVIGLAGLSAFAALLLAGCSWRPAVAIMVASVITAGIATVAPGWAPGQADQKILTSLDPLPLFTPDELPRQVDFSTPEASARTIVRAAHRGQKDILREAVTPAVAAELEKHNEWERFFKPGNAVDPDNLDFNFFTLEPDRAKRDGVGREIYVRIDGKWKLDTLDYASRLFIGPFTPAAESPQPAPVKPPQQPVVVAPKEDPITTVRLLNRLANEQNAEAFLARKYQKSSSFGGDVPATTYMAPFYGEILQIGELPRGLVGGTDIVAKFKRPDGKEEFLEFRLTLQEKEWRLFSDRRPDYRAWTLVEFKPPQGNAVAILKNHLGKDPFHPVPGSNERFLIAGDEDSASVAQEIADRRCESLEKSLREAGLAQYFKVLAPALAPTEPWMGGEPEVPEIPPANP